MLASCFFFHINFSSTGSWSFSFVNSSVFFRRTYLPVPCLFQAIEYSAPGWYFRFCLCFLSGCDRDGFLYDFPWQFFITVYMYEAVYPSLKEASKTIFFTCSFNSFLGFPRTYGQLFSLCDRPGWCAEILYLFWYGMLWDILQEFPLFWAMTITVLSPSGGLMM